MNPVLQEALATARKVGATRRETLALIEAGIVESGLRPLHGGDRDSTGFLQQRPSQGWGPVGESVATDTRQFLAHARALTRQGFKGSAGQLAQAVQRSAYPGRYDQQAGQARGLLSGAAPSFGGMKLGAGGAGVTADPTGGQLTTDPAAVARNHKRGVLFNYLAQNDPHNPLLGVAALWQPRPEQVSSPATAGAPSAQGTSAGIRQGARPRGQLLELIYNDGGSGFAVKKGQRVNGAKFYGDVWAGHQDHVHVATGPKQVVALGKLAQRMGLHVGENPHFGGVEPVHAQDSYHYKGEAIDVSGDPRLMRKFAARVQRTYGL